MTASVPAVASPFTRIHILPDTLAHSPASVMAAYPLPTRLLAATQRLLAPLPAPLIEAWLRLQNGHIIIGPSQHVFIAGPNPAYSRILEDVAWVQASRLVEDTAAFLIPIGQLLHHLILDRWQLRRPPHPAIWAQFWGGVASCHRAGYAASPEALADIDLYLAEGIARWLADRSSLNLQDPRFEKLLAATLFETQFYRGLGPPYPAPQV